MKVLGKIPYVVLALTTLVIGSYVVVHETRHSDAQSINFSPVHGAIGASGNNGANGSNGNNGSAATVSVGTVSSLPAGSTPTVTNTGTTSAAVLAFQLVVGNTGSTGPAGVNAIGYPSARTVSLATAYQCTDTTKPCIVTINIQSTAAISLSGGTTNTGNALIGSSNAVASGTGSIVCVHGNSNTGTLTIGLNLSTVATTQCTMPIPIGGYFAVRQIAGTISIISSWEQTIG